jgi:hypothetical protein
MTILDSPNTTNKRSTLKLNKHRSPFQLQRESLIVATVIISESEIKRVLPDYDASFETEKPTYFKKILHELGLDTTLTFTRQDGLWHRNRLNEKVLCSRYVGEERQDEEWIKSGYASQEAQDKYSRNKILEDMYRTKSLTKDTQEVLESRDHYSVIDESVWE